MLLFKVLITRVKTLTGYKKGGKSPPVVKSKAVAKKKTALRVTNFRKIRRKENTLMKTTDFIVLIIRLFLGFVFFSSGLCKLTDGNFGQLIGPPHLITDLAEYGLAGFGKLIAISQILIGTLILTQRFSLPGLIALIPMNISILGVTLSQEWQGTPYINAFLLLLNLLCVFYEFHTIKILFLRKTSSSEAAKSIRFFPSIQLPSLIFGFSLISILFAEKGGIKLDILASITLLLIALNLIQFKYFLFSEKMVIFFYTTTVLMIVNFRIIRSHIEYSEYFFAGVIGIGFIWFLISLFQRSRSKQKFISEIEILE